MISPANSPKWAPSVPDLPQFYFRFGRPEDGGEGNETSELETEFSSLGNEVPREDFSVIVKVGFDALFVSLSIDASVHCMSLRVSTKMSFCLSVCLFRQLCTL